jgi:hypothetical protein
MTYELSGSSGLFLFFISEGGIFSRQGFAFGILSGVCKYTLGLTGTLMGGYALDLFYLIYRTHLAVMLADDNSWNNPTGFMNKYGVLERITSISEEDGLTVKSKKMMSFKKQSKQFEQVSLSGEKRRRYSGRRARES